MHTYGTNIYKTARTQARLTQEQAAELLALSVESVKAYELGQRTPSAQTVRAMAEVYGSPGLRLEHARETDELDIIPRQAWPRAFPLAAIALCSRLFDWTEHRRGQQLLRIAEDGEIDDAERPIFEDLLAELEDVAAAWLALKVADAKKERPEAGTSKRSVPITGNHCKAIITAPQRDCKPYFCAGGEANSP